MLFLVSETFNPYFNIATEEYILHNFAEDMFYLYRNSPSIIVGKNQNTLAEINYEYVNTRKIPVVRRLSGGGAVFHDLGNLNFCFITKRAGHEGIDFRSFTTPIIDALLNVNINAKFTGRNDLTIDGKKFSGNAQYHHKSKTLHHGTLMFSANINDLSAALKVKPSKYQSKGIKSVKSRVTNIASHLETPLTIEQFIDLIAKQVISNDKQRYLLTEVDKKQINVLVKNKYNTWDWTYGKSPSYTVHNELKYDGGTIEFYVDVKKGVIKSVKFFGDFFGTKDINEIENTLKNIDYSAEAIVSALSDLNISDYFSKITITEFTKGFFA